MVKTSPSNAGSACLSAKKKKTKKQERKQQKQYCNKFNKDFKNGPRDRLPWWSSG